VLVRFDHIASRIVNVDHSMMRSAPVHCVPDCIADGIRFAVPQATEWQRVTD
jgi:hypothetical protein